VSESTSETSTTTPAHRGILKHLGPGLVTACVVIGPGSILTSSKVGATDGYSRGWVVLAACFFMMVYTTLAARLGVVSGESTCDLVRRHARGVPGLAALIGLSVFFISAAFQFGNNLGVHSAFATYIDFKELPIAAKLAPVIIFNGLSLAFLFGFKNLYRMLERLMAIFVGVMLAAFAINLCFAGPVLGDLFRGFVPGVGNEAQNGINIELLGLVGTTFVITAAFYQSYLVRFRGWTVGQLKDGLLDARVSATIMALITLMIVSTSAAVFFGKLQGSVDEKLADVSAVANQLKPAFGEKGRVLFCIGLFSAAYSSFLVNSMIGGFILADGLGLGNTPEDRWPRIMTAVVLLTGMGVAMYVIITEQKPVPAIVAAQAVTVLAAPLVAGVLWWLTNKKEVMGERTNTPTINVLAGLGFALLLAIAAYTATAKVAPKIKDWMSASPAAAAGMDGANDTATGK
jgi:manganese transport protein